MAAWRSRASWLCLGLLLVYAASLLSIGLTRDWRLLHEDNGAMQTTFALAHRDLGLATTRGQDLFFEPASGDSHFYGHHGSAASLLIAAAFGLTGSDAPRVARATAIAFHLTTLLLFVALLRVHFSPALALLGGLFFATLPMSTYFGRMVNYEPFCLTGVVLQLYGYARLRARGSRAGWWLLGLGIAFGGLVDWPAYFFAGALALVELSAALRGERPAWRRCAAIAGMAVGALLVELAHIALATGSLGPLLEVVRLTPPDSRLTVRFFLAREFGFGRGYFGDAAILATVLLATAFVLPSTPLGRPLAAAAHARVLSRWVGASGLAALGYCLAAPSWAVVHAYWLFYALPFVCTALVLLVADLLDRLRAHRHAWLYGALLVALFVEVGNTSVRMLRKRHTAPEAYAIRVTQELRERYLRPSSQPQTP